MGAEVLRSEKGGYIKEDVLAKLDSLNALLFAVESGMPRDKAISELEKINSVELRREKAGFFGKFGFSAADTDPYISELLKKITDALK